MYRHDDVCFLCSQKEEDIVFETFYHRSGKEFQCIYQSGMRFYLDDWGSKVTHCTLHEVYQIVGDSVNQAYLENYGDHTVF